MELSLDILIRATGGKLANADAGTLATILSGASVDSRTISQGQIFFALPGDNFDGHDYVAAAAGRGAAAVVISSLHSERFAAGLPAGTAVVAVADPHKALLDLAAAAARLHTATKIAISGSTGKTTVKDMLLSIAQVNYKAVASARSYNNEIGVPLTILNADPACDFLILEVGMRSPGDVALLAKVISPSIGIITNVGPSHIGRLGSLEAIANAKAELLEHVSHDGAVVLNSDDAFSAAMASKAVSRVIWFGGEGALGVSVRTIPAEKLDATKPVTLVEITYEGRTVQAAMPILGVHQASNAAAAAAGAIACGIPMEEIATGLSRAGLSPMRMEVSGSSCGATIINDAYNANPDSMASALRTLAGISAGRRIAVLGSMKELGDYSAEAHRQIGRLIATLPIEFLLTVGEEAADIADAAIESGIAAGRAESYQVISCTDVDAAKLLVEEMIDDGRIGSNDLVLVKASRAVGLERIVEALKGASAQEVGI